MSDEFYLISGDSSVSLHSVSERRWVIGAAGFGMPPVAHITQQAPLQHGATYLYRLYRPRVVRAVVLQHCASRDELWEARRVLMELLKRETLVLRWNRDGTSYDLDVQYRAGMEYDSGESLGLYDYRAELELVAYDPFWRSPTRSVITVGIPTSDDSGIFPWSFPVTFGSSLINAYITIEYEGTWPSYPEIDIVGPITNPSITNETTGEKLELNMAVSDGQTVRINVRDKTVRDVSTGDNLLGYLTSDSDIATFHIACAPEAVKGVNSLHVVGTLAGEGTAVVVRYYTRYLGL